MPLARRLVLCWTASGFLLGAITGAVAYRQWQAARVAGPMSLGVRPSLADSVRIASLAELASRADVVLLGDSILQCFADHPDEFAKLGDRVACLGVWGDTVGNTRWLVQAGVLGRTPLSAIVVLIGTDDLDRGVSPPQIVEQVRELVVEIRERQPAAAIVLVGLLPRPERSVIDSINQNLSSIENVDFVTAIPEHRPSLFVDEVHPNRLGYRAMAGVLAERLKMHRP